MSKKSNEEKPTYEPFGNLMKSMHQFFHERPVKGILETMDEFFTSPNLFSGFPVQYDETKDEHIIQAKLPGVKKEDVTIEILQSYVTITVENYEMEIMEDSVHQSSFKKQHVRKSTKTIPLSSPIDESKANASYKNGLLVLRLPKRKGKNITIVED
ncbi:hypothetical protein Q73_07930 [Bacillus coahuilensis m2-6]|uniref:Hsp20/alpha crystallin family protein n=1 Tax=Bacillus coahuilensis TaxID=408580 RepID=UPI000750127A|nr:Hsp20/alpha crystallin family protein [Bacillus coahuilensis]KUP08020.1 hypothetical protein Q73_07930 [Bacillus coahuilensis m2-6]